MEKPVLSDLDFGQGGVVTITKRYGINLFRARELPARKELGNGLRGT